MTSGERKPLPRPTLKKIEHEPTGTRLRLNPITRQSEEYKLEGKIVYEEASGNFLLQWSGIDGRRKTIIYEPATKLDAVIAAAVEYKAEANLYRYSYALSNLRTSRQKLQSYYVETLAPADQVQAPDETWGYSGPLTDYLRQELQVKGGWTWSQTRQGLVGLLPGEQATGFSFVSAGLPAVVRCYVRHYTVLKGVDEELPEELHAAIDRVVWKIPHGVTIGPASPPRRLDPVAFLQGLIQVVDVSLQQGWIESPAVAQETTKLLESAATTLQGGDAKRASATLRTLLHKVEGEKDRSLLSEAYALLKFNLEFLLRQIGG